MTKPTITPTSKKMVIMGNPDEKGEAVTTDIVERLRFMAPATADPLHSDLLEAADEIESLQEQAAVAELAVLKLQDEIERLRAALRIVPGEITEEERQWAIDEIAREEAAIRNAVLDEAGAWFIKNWVSGKQIASALQVIKENN